MNIWLFVVCAASVAFTSGQRFVCYYTNWSQYRHGKGTFVPENVDPMLCTHLMYSFAKPQGLDIVAFEWNDDSTAWSEGMYSRTTKLKEKNPALKICLALGGYNMASAPFVPLVATASSRATFAQNAIKFLRDRNFDGLDVDWEYPAASGSTAADKDRYVLFMEELRKAFEAEAASSGKPRLLLTAALPAGKLNIDAGFDVPKVMQHVDFISIMAYDLHGSWEPYTGINSPLYANTKDTGNDAYLNVAWVAQYYLSLGAPADKMNLGVALYARSFLLDNPNQHDIGSPAGQPGDAGLFTGEKGFLAYYEICDLIFSDATVVDVPSQHNRYLYKDRLWAGYEDRDSVKEKACYAKYFGFGGLMFWALDLDDFTGQTCKQGTYPLIRTAMYEMQNPLFDNCADHSLTDSPQMNQTSTQSPDSTPGHTTSHPHSDAPAIIPTDNFNCTNKDNDFYPDLNSCGDFFVCINEVAYVADCGHDLMFNPDTKHCEKDHIADCDMTTVHTTHPPPATSTVTTQAVHTTTANQICVGHHDGTIPHPTDCHKFFLCASEIAMELQCQGSMVFNPAAGACDFSTCIRHVQEG